MSTPRALLAFVPILALGTAACSEPDQYCCDTECGYYVQLRPSEASDQSYGTFGPSKKKWLDCPEGTSASLNYCETSFGRPTVAACTIETYWGATSEADGATMDAVVTKTEGTAVVVKITVSLPGTGIWAEPAVLALVTPGDEETSSQYVGEYKDLIAYPGGVSYTQVFERRIKKQDNARVGLVRVDDPRQKFTIGATSKREVELNRPRVWTTVRSAQ